MSGSEWQVVDTLQKKKQKLKQKRAENAVENAAKEKLRQEEERERQAEFKRLGLGYEITDVSSDYKKKQQKGGKVKGGKQKVKAVEANYDIHIPKDENKKIKNPNKNKESKKTKEPKEPKEPSDKKGRSLAEACEAIDTDALRAELKNVEIQYSSLPLAQLQRFVETLEASFPKIKGFSKDEGHLYRRIQTPIRTLQASNEQLFEFTREWLGDRPIPSEFAAFLADLIAEGGSQGVAVRIAISLLARYHPQKIVAESNHIFSKLPPRAAAYVFLQTMYADPDLAMLLWVKHFLPLFYKNEKENSEAVVYLACLLTYIRKKGHKISVPMPADDLAAELGKFLSARANSSEKGFTLIKDHYYELLDSAFIMSKNPKEFFLEMLTLTSSDSTEVSNAAFDVIVYNLKTNPEIFRIWKEIYEEHVVETNNVLVFILQNYEHIQTSSLPPIVREPYTYASDVSSSDEGSDAPKKERKGSKIREIGATMELNGKLLSASRKHAGPAKARPIPVRELQLLLTRVEEVNEQLAVAKGPKKAQKVSKQSLQVCNATCRALREAMKQSRSGRDASGGGGCAGTLVKLTVVVAGLAGIVGFALKSNPELFDKLLS